MAGLERQIFEIYGDDTVVHPDDGDDTTLGFAPCSGLLIPGLRVNVNTV
ncbi:MAG: hypothetical protein ACR2JI_16225 [Mycobacterium sp.]